MNAPMQPQYRNYQQQTQRSPHALTTSRRGPGPMVGGTHSQSAASSSQMIAHKNAQHLELDAAKRRAKKPTDKNMPEGVEDVIIGDGVQHYKNLREVERRLDAAMVRKRLDLQSARYRRHERRRTLRIWISNTADNQPWQRGDLEENTFDFSSGIDSTYRVKIEGRLLDEGDENVDSDSGSDDENPKLNGTGSDAMDHDGKANGAKTGKLPLPRKKFSAFFKSMTVDFDRSKSLQPEVASQVEWEKGPASNPHLPQAGADFDSLEFERKSDENINCTINLFRDENPEHFKLSKELADVLDCEEETREGIVYGIWDYISVMNLQQDEEKRMIQCDDALRNAFKRDTIIFPQIPQLITQHITPLPPLKLPYTIRVDPDYHAAPTKTVYDVPVAVDDPLTLKMAQVMANPAYGSRLKEIAALDDELAVMVQAITHSKARHAFFTSMSRDPARFVRRWTSSQKKDLEVILGEASRGVMEEGLSEEFRRGGKGGVWGTESVRESVGLMVSRR